MTWLEAALAGLVQGLTEFIPVSSTAHVVIVGYLFGRATPGLAFEIWVHLGSLLAVLLYFRRDLEQLLLDAVKWLRGDRSGPVMVSFWFVIYLGVGTLLTAVLGTLLLKQAGEFIKHPYVVTGALLLTAVLLLLVDRMKAETGRDSAAMRWRDALVVGLAQTISVTPGLSRSGSTLIAGILMGLRRDTAVRFSFLLAVPVLAGGGLLTLRELFKQGEGLLEIGLVPLAISFILSFLASMVSIMWLINFLKTQRLFLFSIYLCVLAAVVFFAFPPDMIFGEP